VPNESFNRETAVATESPNREAPATIDSLIHEVVHRSRDGFAITRGADHVIEYVNPSFCALARQAGDALLSRRFADAFHEISPAMLDRAYSTGGAEASVDHAMVAVDERPRYLSYEIARLHGGLVVTARDTTDQVLLRQELGRIAEEMRAVNERLVISSVREQEHAESAEQHRAQLQALFARLNEAVVIADPTGRIVMVNDAARVVLGIVSEGRPTVATLSAMSATRLDGRPLSDARRPLLRALRGEVFDGYELLCDRPDGEVRRLVTAGTHIKDDQGNVVLGIVVFRDVTELRRLEQQREEYTALISHDLRGPLSAVLMLTQTLRQSLAGKGLEADRGIAERVERSAGQMNSMIEELLDATSLESRAIELRRRPWDFGELVVDVIEGMDDERKRRVAVETKGARYPVLGDAGRLERAVSNLVANALKYSPDGSPVRLVLARGATDEVVLEVTDQGIGIAPEDLHNIFNRYYRAPRSRRFEGLGLGLYITRLIAEAHGGRVEVVSVVGHGSTFRLVLPLRLSPA
jgi:two-component system, NtrC family, sensor histidine kinase KinB